MTTPVILLNPQKDTAKLASLFTAFTWMPLCREYPQNGERVLVMMLSGRLEFAKWDAIAGMWNYDPFVAWQIPAYWAALPLARRKLGGSGA